jgi:hypothetical protein
LAALASTETDQRVAAARELRVHAAAAVLPLCDALVDPHNEVQIAAAESLGEIGDPRAIAPLSTALRLGLIGGSGPRQLRAGLLLISVLILAVAGFLWGAIAWRIGGGFVGIFNLWVQLAIRHARRRGARSQVSRAISEALVRIAEQHPSPQLRELLPELRALSADHVYQDPGARRASRAAAQRIEALTDELKSLPISSRPAATDAASLPVAVSLPAAEYPDQRSSGKE